MEDFQIEVAKLEFIREEARPKFIGYCAVDIKPVGIRVANIRVFRDKRGDIQIQMPSLPKDGAWSPSVSLPSEMLKQLRAVILDELAGKGIVSTRPPRRENLMFNPDEIEEENV